MKTLFSILLLLPSLAFSAPNVIPSAHVPQGKSIFVDTTLGADNTGQRGRVDKPFRTVLSALAVALAGDTVQVAPGQYDAGTNNILRCGVNYYFQPGSYVTWSNADMSADVYCLFDDRQTGPTTNFITGAGRFFASAYRTGTDDANFNLHGMISVTNTGTELHFTGKRLEVEAPTLVGSSGYFGALNVFDGKVWLDVDEIVDTYPGDGGTHSSSALGIYWQLGEIHVKCNRLVIQGYYGLWGHDPSAGTSRANFWYDGNSLVSSNFVGIYMDGPSGVSSPNYRGWFNIKEVTGGQLGYSFLGGSKVYITGQKVSATTGTAIDSGNILWANIEKVSGTNSLIVLRGGESYISVQHYEDLMADGQAGTKKIHLISGNNRFFGGFYKAANTNAIYAIHVVGGTNFFHDFVTDMSKAGTTNAFSVYMDATNGTALTLQNCFFQQSGSTSNAILSTNAQSIVVRGALWCSTNIHPNVSIWGGFVDAPNRNQFPAGNVLTDFGRRNVRWIINTGSGTSFTGIGDSGTIATFGTAYAISADSTGPASVGMPTAGSVNSQVSVSGNANYRMGKNCESVAWAGPTNLASFTFWHVLSDQAPATMTGANPAGNYAGLRYDSLSSDATYKLITKDGTTQTVTDTGVALGNGFHVTRVVCDDLAQRVIGYIDGVAVATNKANLPTAAVMMRYTVSLTTNVGTTNALRMGWCQNFSQN